MRKTLTALLVVLSLSACGKKAPVQPSHIFTDHMVLQRDRPVKVWGTSDKGAKVSLKWQGKTYSCQADPNGRWEVEIPASPTGGPYEMKINDITLKDVLVGDVYLCSGQSNMELPVKRCLGKVGQDVKGYSNDKIRYFQVPKEYAFGAPKEDIGEAKWQVLDSDSTAMDWSAVCYFTARELQQREGIPIGMVCAAVGGSPIEAWTEEGRLEEKAKGILSPYKDKHYLDSVINFNKTLYSVWQEAHNAKPSNPNATWKPIDMFSKDWAVDPKGENIYGSHLLKNTFNLTASQASGEATLHLGAMVDADSAFVNGKYVGNTTYMYPPRNYKVPAGVLKEGENTVEIHLYACGGNPASFVKDKDYSLETKDGNVSLLKGWSHKEGKRMDARPGEDFLIYKPSGLWNAMVYPIRDFTTNGVIWYQGESNCDDAASYGRLLETLVTSWRDNMKREALPFYIIELAAFQHSEETDNDFGWNRVQKEQRTVAGKVKGVHLVKNSDIGEWNDIHPQDKKTVGKRTADEILKK